MPSPDQTTDLSSVRARLRQRGRGRPAVAAPGWPTGADEASGPANPLVRASSSGAGPLLPGPPPRRRGAGWAAAVLTAVGATLLGLVAVDRWRAPAEPGRPGPAAPAPTTTGPPTPTTTTAPAPTAERVWAAERQAAPNVVTFEGARYAVGEAGDVVEVGDWACDGRPTAVVLRPSTGEVLAFDGWPPPGDHAVARPLARVDGATRLQAADPDGDGCHSLHAVGGDGRTVPVDASARDRSP